MVDPLYKPGVEVEPDETIIIDDRIAIQMFRKRQEFEICGIYFDAQKQPIKSKWKRIVVKMEHFQRFSKGLDMVEEFFGPDVINELNS